MEKKRTILFHLYVEYKKQQQYKPRKQKQTYSYRENAREKGGQVGGMGEKDEGIEKYNQQLQNSNRDIN